MQCDHIRVVIVIGELRFARGDAGIPGVERSRKTTEVRERREGVDQLANGARLAALADAGRADDGGTRRPIRTK